MLNDPSRLNNKRYMLNKLVEEGFPPRLYKYRSFNNNSQSIFTERQLWFASASSFNDPFDGQIYDEQAYKHEDIVSYLRKQHVSEEQLRAIMDHESKNPGFVHTLVEQTKAESLQKRGILSLSTRCDDILMWSHYCSSHEGFVLGFDILEDPEFFMDCFLVRYQEKYPSFQYITESEKLVSHGLLTKSIHWSYEQEARIIKNTSGIQTFNSKALKEVICGARTTEANKIAIESYLKESHFAHVVLKQAKCSKINYALEI